MGRKFTFDHQVHKNSWYSSDRPKKNETLQVNHGANKLLKMKTLEEIKDFRTGPENPNICFFYAIFNRYYQNLVSGMST